MGEKKGKALALELIDDLLNEKSQHADSSSKGEPDKTEDIPGTIVQPRQSPAPYLNDPNDKTLDLKNIQQSEEDSEALQAAVSASVPSGPTGPEEEDATIRIGTRSAAIAQIGQPGPAHNPQIEGKVRASVGRHGVFRAANVPMATEAALAQSESLRIAQGRIIELEQEIERLRLQNEQLGAAGETLRRRADELLAENHKREGDYQDAISKFEQEKLILSSSKEAMQREIESLKRKNDELELRISTNIQKIRVRERELENRLELVKMESSALIRSKDEIILDLKRQMDQLNIELSNYRAKNQELNRQGIDKQEMLRRTVKALRLALSMLEGEEETPKGSTRKAK